MFTEVSSGGVKRAESGSDVVANKTHATLDESKDWRILSCMANRVNLNYIIIWFAIWWDGL